MIAFLDLLKNVVPIIVIICFIGIALSMILLIYRILKGPTNPDRAAALDVIGVCLMATAALTAILIGTTKLNDVVLLISILSFIGTLALAKYIEMGVIIDRDDD